MVDEKLVRDAQSGDEAAFARLVEACYDSIYRLALRWAGSRADAEDIAQIVCVKLGQSIRSFRFDAKFSTWLYQIVLNCARDWSRSQKRHLHDELEQEPAAHSSGADAGIQLRQVLTKVARMGEGYRETLLLVFAEGLSHAEAALILKVKESTVSWRIHEIRKQLSET